VSDIKIEFTWEQLALLALLIGWPGALLGAVAGGLVWRRHPIPAVVAGAIVGLVLWVGVRILLR
jgi:Na+/proline symporter